MCIRDRSKTAETYSEVVEGMQFDRGYITPYMVTDTEKMEAVIDDAYILITDKKISVIQDLLPLLEQIVQSGKDVYKRQALTGDLSPKGVFYAQYHKVSRLPDGTDCVLQYDYSMPYGTAGLQQRMPEFQTCLLYTSRCV